MTLMTPLVILEFLRGMAPTQQLFFAAVLLFIGWELFRAISVGKRAGGALGSFGFYTIVVFIAAAIFIALGWVDPNPSVVSRQLSIAIDAVLRFVADQAGRFY